MPISVRTPGVPGLSMGRPTRAAAMAETAGRPVCEAGTIWAQGLHWYHEPGARRKHGAILLRTPLISIGRLFGILIYSS